MPTYDATEAHDHVAPAMMDRFKEALAEADRDGMETVSVIIVNGVPILYNIRDKA